MQGRRLEAPWAWAETMLPIGCLTLSNTCLICALATQTSKHSYHTKGQHHREVTQQYQHLSIGAHVGWERLGYFQMANPPGWHTKRSLLIQIQLPNLEGGNAGGNCEALPKLSSLHDATSAGLISIEQIDRTEEIETFTWLQPSPAHNSRNLWFGSGLLKSHNISHHHGSWWWQRLSKNEHRQS